MLGDEGGFLFHGGVGEFGGEELGAAADDGEGVVHFMGGAGGHFAEAGEGFGADELLLEGAEFAVGGGEGFGEDGLLFADLGGAEGHAEGLADEEEIGHAGHGVAADAGGAGIFGDPDDAADGFVAAEEGHRTSSGWCRGRLGRTFHEPVHLGGGGAGEVLVGASDTVIAAVGGHAHHEAVLDGFGGIEEEDFADAPGVGGGAGVASPTAAYDPGDRDRVGGSLIRSCRDLRRGRVCADSEERCLWGDMADFGEGSWAGLAAGMMR